MIALCTAWSVFSITNLIIFSPLFFVQLLVIWGTRYWLNKLNNLEDSLQEKNLRIRELLSSVPEFKKVVISGKQHKDILVSSISDAKESLIIYSGWLTTYVIDDQFIELLDAALSKGCRIYIGYGYADHNNKHNTLPTGMEAFNKLRMLQNKYKSLLHIGKFNTHEKLLIKDSELIIFGSTNWLANNKFNNSERSIVIYCSEISANERDRAIDIVINNPA